jgi:hypothetical protein
MRSTLLLLIGVCLVLLDEGGIATIVGIPPIKQVVLAGQRSEPRSLYQRPDGEWFLCKGVRPADPAASLGAVTGAAATPARGSRSGLAVSGKGPTAKLDQLASAPLDAWTLIGPNAVADRCARLTGQTPS